MHSLTETDVAARHLGDADLTTRRVLEQGLEGRPIDDAQATHLITLPPARLSPLLAVAGHVRSREKGRTLTYSPNVFLPLTNLCRNRCSYCTFRRDPDSTEAWTMSPEQVLRLARHGHDHGCTEALLCMGERPENAFAPYRKTLASFGCRSTTEYVEVCCGIALAEGLLPHTNAGVLTRDEMKRLKPLNASMGLMLENVSPRLRESGGPHHRSPDKEPGLRLRMLREAGELQIPFTTGILIGIGESPEERIASLRAIGDLHERYRHVQEIIIQNFRAKHGTPMAHVAEPQAHEVAAAVAVTRLMFPTMNIQAAPNLNPSDYRLLLAAGINDWGGISPLTTDFVNPEAPWPQVSTLDGICRSEGFALDPRLPIYPEFVQASGFLDPGLLGHVRTLTATQGAADAR